MLSKICGTGKRRLVVGGVLSLAVLAVGHIGWLFYHVHSSHRDYYQFEDCLNKHGLAVKEGWQYTDEGLEIIGLPALENFGWTFAVSDGQLWQFEVIDGYRVRDCNDRVAFVWLDGRSMWSLSKGRVLSLQHPELLKALDGQKIDTMDDLVAQLEWLLNWASEHPDAFLDASELPVLSSDGGLIHLYEADLY